jgi:hypothetical protein
MVTHELGQDTQINITMWTTQNEGVVKGGWEMMLSRQKQQLPPTITDHLLF